MDKFPAFTDYILVFVFGVLIPFVSGIRSATVFKENQIEFDTVSKRKFYFGNSFFLILIACIVLLVWQLYHRPFTELGFRYPSDTPYGLHWWLTGLFIFLYLGDSLISIQSVEKEEAMEQLATETPFMPARWADLPAYFLMCVAAAVGEEIVYRGYLVTFFKYIFANVPGASTLAILVPAAIFSAAHFYQGGKTVFKILVLSLLFGMIYWHTSSLLIVIFLHFGVDLISGLLSIYVSRKEN